MCFIAASHDARFGCVLSSHRRTGFATKTYRTGDLKYLILTFSKY